MPQMYFQLGWCTTEKRVNQKNGFIEYPDINTAEMAIRYLKGYELNNRVLRVVSTAGEPAPLEDNLYGSEYDAGNAPDRISRTITSVAPEKMFDLVKHLQEALKNSPAELSSILVENPQLPYAALQAAVVMIIVDPQTALELLRRIKSSTLQPFHQTYPFFLIFS